MKLGLARSSSTRRSTCVSRRDIYIYILPIDGDERHKLLLVLVHEHSSDLPATTLLCIDLDIPFLLSFLRSGDELLQNILVVQDIKQGVDIKELLAVGKSLISRGRTCLRGNVAAAGTVAVARLLKLFKC
jgi:hypothetical protein